MYVKFWLPSLVQCIVNSRSKYLCVGHKDGIPVTPPMYSIWNYVLAYFIDLPDTRYVFSVTMWCTKRIPGELANSC